MVSRCLRSMSKQQANLCRSSGSSIPSYSFFADLRVLAKRLLIVGGAGLALAGCAAPINSLSQGPAGFDAIEFQRTVQVRDHAWNIYTFAAGSRFIADRTTTFGPVYCGQSTLNGQIVPFVACIGVEGADTIVIGPAAGFKEVRRPQPSGTFKRIKVRL